MNCSICKNSRRIEYIVGRKRWFGVCKACSNTIPIPWFIRYDGLLSAIIALGIAVIACVITHKLNLIYLFVLIAYAQFVNWRSFWRWHSAEIERIQQEMKNING